MLIIIDSGDNTSENNSFNPRTNFVLHGDEVLEATEFAQILSLVKLREIMRAAVAILSYSEEQNYS